MEGPVTARMSTRDADLRGAALLPALAAALILACGRGEAPSAPTPPPTPVAESATPAATETGPPGVRSVMQATCSTSLDGSQIKVTYSARAEGGTLLSRVRLLIDGRLREDSGPLSQKEFAWVATFPVQAGVEHIYQVVAEAPGSPPASVRSTVKCPGPPVSTPGPRA